MPSYLNTMKYGSSIGLGLAAAFLIFCMAGLSTPHYSVSRLPALPKDKTFEVTAAVVELMPTDALLAGGDSFKTLLNDLPRRSTLGLEILNAKADYGSVVRAEKTKTLKQGDSFALSFQLPKENDTEQGKDPYLQHVAVEVQLDSVDTLKTAEIQVNGAANWYADLMKTNHSNGFGAGIGGFPRCLNLSAADWIPLFVQNEGSAWIVVSVQQVD